MGLYVKLENDMKAALKEGDAVRLSVLRMVISAVKTAEIDKKIKALPEADIMQVLQRHIKQHRESIEQFKSGNRPDLAKKEADELRVLETYLPEQLSESAVDELVRAAIKETGASTKADMGRLMKVVMEKAKGLCDGKLVSQTVTKYLK
jgi:uncharacterized protein YqeY